MDFTEVFEKINALGVSPDMTAQTVIELLKLSYEWPAETEKPKKKATKEAEPAAEKPTPKEKKKPAPKTDPVKAEGKTETPGTSLDILRSLFATASQKGHKKKLFEILNGFKAAKLPQLAESDYEAVAEKVRGLING